MRGTLYVSLCVQHGFVVEFVCSLEFHLFVLSFIPFYHSSEFLLSDSLIQPPLQLMSELALNDKT